MQYFTTLKSTIRNFRTNVKVMYRQKGRCTTAFFPFVEKELQTSPFCNKTTPHSNIYILSCTSSRMPASIHLCDGMARLLPHKAAGTEKMEWFVSLIFLFPPHPSWGLLIASTKRELFLNIPDFFKEGWKLFVLDFEGEAQLRVHVAQST